MERRDFLWLGAAVVGRSFSPALIQTPAAPQADIRLRIAPVQLEIAPKRVVKTIGYNGTVPGPLIRCHEGDRLTIEVRNDSANHALVHWHGLHIPSDVDGADEEGTPMVPPSGTAHYQFTAAPSGSRWYHAHGFAGRNLNLAAYTGQFGFLYIEPKREAGAYDQEVFLAIHGWEPSLVPMGDPDGTLDVEYKYFSVNSHSLGAGDPVRVREGQRVMFRILNASATSTHRLALPGHTFMVVALDGNPVPAPTSVEAIELAPAERVDAVVTMNAPGVWVLGDVDEKTRRDGLGVVVEYAGQTGAAQWSASRSALDAPWDYTVFGASAPRPADGTVAPVLTLVPLIFKKKFAGHRWVDNWTVNGKSFPATDPIKIESGRRYRLQLVNDSDEAHPVHLHRHSFELVSVGGKPTTGVVKDVVVVPAMSRVEADFTADNPGPTLFHCHQQLHMDYGFMTLLTYA
ncbi:MAG TPA: multicopper oxidase family protein [Vicinamibacterales bacterium]|jgi:FtsP/CotA-like multicopper oxidase with cupredoxin domain|nr:multicopper oxidase family protein [Vicinamibacterales bacterium]